MAGAFLSTGDGPTKTTPSGMELQAAVAKPAVGYGEKYGTAYGGSAR